MARELLIMGIKHEDVVVSGQSGEADHWNKDHVIDGDVDFDQKQLDNAVVENRTAWPPAPEKGQLVFRSDLNRMFWWNGTNWVSNPWYHSGGAAPTMTYNGEVCIWANPEDPEGMVEWYTGAVSGSDQIWGNRWCTQSFTIGTLTADDVKTLTKVRMYMRKINNPPNDLTVEIRSDDGAGKPTGVILASATVPVAGFPVVLTWVECPINGFELQPSTKYHLVLRTVLGDVGNFYQWRCEDDVPQGPYLGGHQVNSVNGGAGWTIQTIWDMRFQIWATAAAAASRTVLVVRSDGADIEVALD